MNRMNKDIGYTPAEVNEYEGELKAAKHIVSKMADSKKMVLSGFVVALLGISLYCYLTLVMQSADNRLIWGSLSVVGAGFCLWFVGAIRYFNLAIDSGDSDAVF